MNNIKRLIFDVDETLITNIDFTPFVKEALKKIEMYSRKNVIAFFNNMKTYEKTYNNYNAKDYIEHMGQNMDRKLPLSFLDILFEELKSAIPTENEKLVQTLSKLSEKYELVLLTNYFRKSQTNRLNSMGIGHFFKECYGQELIKPNEDAYMLACGQNKPCECVMIGDDIYLDIERAKELGLNTIFVNTKNISNKKVDTITVQAVNEIDYELIDKCIGQLK